MKIKNRQQLLLILAAGVVGVFIADRIVFTPLTNAWKARSERITDLRNRVTKGESLLKLGQDYRARWSQMRTNTLPNTPSLAEQQLLKAVNGWAQESRITLTSESPQPKRDADDYLTLQCRVEATGSLDAVTRFLYAIEHDPLAVRIDTVELSTRDTTGQQLNLGLQLSGLVLNPPTQ
jgi:Tfp pilus assembly protein PilO